MGECSFGDRKDAPKLSRSVTQLEPRRKSVATPQQIGVDRLEFAS